MWLRAEGRKGGFWRSVESGSSVERIDKCMYRERAMEGRRKEESTIRVSFNSWGFSEDLNYFK